ncbi:type IV pilus assembly protein FimV [Salinicola aestuarinus]|uniref:type IV pilus assembly protein FimV n=1 Tax=Salinicola aestuarinus TaxID=1949082 RepID=UPI000DA240C6|nr:hypothetical protein [Salinicola aestuarinus]
MRHRLSLPLGVWLFALTPLVHALGLAEPTDTSALNRPLHVVLPLTDSDAVSMADISVRVADADAYRRAGLVPTALSDTLAAQVESVGGRPSIVLDSPRRVRDPFVDLLLVITWPQGQWQRQVSLLFDPVDYAQAPPLLENAGESVGRDSTPPPTGQSESLRAGAASPAVTRPRSGRERRWPTSLRVRPGSTLSSLAETLGEQGVARRSAMLALYRANPSAFVAGDRDRLRAGVTLSVPAKSAVAAIYMSQALGDWAEASNGEASKPAVEEALDDTQGSDVSLAALRQRVAALDAQAARQRETIAALTAERDRLQARVGHAGEAGLVGQALAAVPIAESVVLGHSAGSSPPDTGGASMPAGKGGNDIEASPEGQSGMATDASPASDGVVDSVGDAVGDVVGDDPSLSHGVAPDVAASDTPSSAAASPAMGLLVEQGRWLAAALLLPLFYVAWRRRQRRHRVSEPAAASVEVPSAADRGGSRDETREADSASISQADIFIAYGRYAEAREWLQPRLATQEDAKQRLALIRVHGELREMEAMEQAFRELPDDAPRAQRQQAQSLVDHYRARYVDESWAEATAGEVSSEPTPEAASSPTATGDAAMASAAGSVTASEAVDSLFESAAGADASGRDVPRADMAVDDAAPDRIDAERYPNDGVSVTSDAGEVSSFSALSASVAAAVGPLPRQAVAPDAPVRGRPSTTIEYVPPPLEREPHTDLVPDDDSTGAGGIRLPTVSFPSLSSGSTAAGTQAHAPLGCQDESAPQQTPGASSHAPQSGSGAGELASSDRGHPLAASGALKGGTIPAEWEVEEVEFERPHRDNSRL